MPTYKSVKPGRKVTELISVQELRQKIWDLLQKEEKDSLSDWRDYEGKCPKKLCVGYGFRSLTPQIAKDLSKVKYDEENVGCDGDDGYLPKSQVLPNGLAVIFFKCGGDWEWPVAFVAYWDGKQLRAYIPSNGNVYNRATKEAYGNNEKKDNEDKMRYYELDTELEDGEYFDYTPKYDWDMMFREVQERIVIDVK